jgi:hypothetical protein
MRPVKRDIVGERDGSSCARTVCPEVKMTRRYRVSFFKGIG